MKITYFMTALVGGLLAAGCQKAVQNVTMPYGSVVVGIKQSARVGQDVTVQVDSIQDSRCPVNADCIWAGNAVVRFTLSDQTNHQPGSLCLGACGQSLKVRDSVNVLLGSDRYQVVLTEVRPFPGTDPKNTQPQAVIQVKKQ